jgi:hypothetical protein
MVDNFDQLLIGTMLKARPMLLARTLVWSMPRMLFLLVSSQLSKCMGQGHYDGIKTLPDGVRISRHVDDLHGDCGRT